MSYIRMILKQLIQHKRKCLMLMVLQNGRIMKQHQQLVQEMEMAFPKKMLEKLLQQTNVLMPAGDSAIWRQIFILLAAKMKNQTGSIERDRGVRKESLD